MPDIIELLPDSVANQIAAGEVIQRPASVVKELLENSVDAGSRFIQLIVKDAGKTLIQVIDDGRGMSETDARLCFERHATSKIKKADDLFAIRTMGFRGEALASIAAIAQVTLKSKREEDEVGTKIEISGSRLETQEPCSTSPGTSLSIKNLFFNVPARRKFLKKESVELRHIIDEFQRVALAYPHISFTFHHNNNELFRLPEGSFKQRVINIFGKNINQKLVPVDEATSIVNVVGFIGKPEFAKKTRGEQFFFVNGRFIKSPYLHHAVQLAFKELLPENYHPSYFIQLEINPDHIDINIHPTKTEIKFEDERSVYTILRSTITKSLGKYNIAPSLDFEQPEGLEIPPPRQNQPIKPPSITTDPNFNPFKDRSKNRVKQEDWEQLFKDTNIPAHENARQETIIQTSWDEQEESFDGKKQDDNIAVSQLQSKFILTQIKSGLMIIHQQLAHERILYEKFKKALDKSTGYSQQQLFPKTIEFSAIDFELVKELKDDITALGFDLREFGKNSFIVQGLPSEAGETDPKVLLEDILEHFKQNKSEVKLDKKEKLARSMARNLAVKPGKNMTSDEMTNLIDQLFSCELPYSSPAGKPTLTTLTIEDLEKRFQ